MTQKPTSHSSKQSSFTIDNFLIEKTIGEGTFGKVKLGVHLPTGEKVAIKILEKDKIQDNEDLERITREIKFLKILKHPNIIKIFQIIEDKKNYYIIMEYAKNGELFTHIVNNKRLSENEAIILYSQLIQALSFIHKHNIVHRDIKPENLLLKHNNILAIIDFGLSNQYKDNKTLNTPCGSPCYAAPEMILGRKYNGLNVDIWSSGIVLYAMVCGYLPFEDKNNDKLYKKILNGHFEMPDRLSPECKDLIKRILIVNPKKRIQLEDIIAHPFLQKGMEWYKETFNDKYFSTSSNEVNYDIIDKTINEMVGYDVDREIVEKYIINNKHNSITTTYYLLLDKEHQHQLCIHDDDNTNNNNDNDSGNNNDKKVSSYDINESYCSNSNSNSNNNNNASTSYTNVIPAKKQKHAKDKELKDKIKNIQINISLSPINTPSPITLFPSNRNNTSISTSTSTTRKFRDYSVTIPSNKPISNTKFYYNLHTVHSKSNNSPLQIKSQRQRDPSLEVSNIIKSHNNNSSNHFLINTPCIITPLNRKIIQKLPAHNRNKNNNNNLIATNLSSNSNKTVHITSTNMKSNHNSFSSNSKKQIDTSITYDNTNIFLKSIEHNKKRQYKLNTHNCNNNSTIHNKLVYIPSNTINLMEDEQDGVNSLNECCSNGNSASNIKRGTSSSFMTKSSSNDNNRSFSQKNKSRIKNNVINSHKNTSSLNYYSNNNSNNKNITNNNNNSSNSNSNRLNKRGLIGQKGSLSGGKDFSPSSRCSSNNKNITLLKLNDNDGNGNSVCYNYNRQGATTPNNSSAISKKYTFKKQIATHHKKPAVIDIDITTTTNNNNNGVSVLNTNAYKKTSTLSLKANKPKQQSNTARNNTNSNNVNKRTDIRIHGFVDLSQNKTTSKNTTTTTNSNNSNTTVSSKTKPQNSNSGTNIYNVSSSSKRKMSTTSIDGDINANTTNANNTKDTSSSSSTPTSSNTTKQQTSNSFCLCTTTSSHDEVIKQLTILATTNNYVLSNINDSTTTRYVCELNSNSICIEISKVGMNNVLKLYHVNGDEQITKEIIKNVIVNIGF